MKNTKLNDSAEIYKLKSSEKVNFSAMTLKEKLKYLYDYYKMTFIVVILFIAIAAYIIYYIFSPKTENVLSVAVINEYFDESKEDAFVEDLNSLLNVDTSRQELLWDSSYVIDYENATSASMSSEQKLATYLGSGQIDVFISDKDYFDTYIEEKVFFNLAEILPTDLCTLLSDDLYIENAEDNSHKLVAYGLSLKNSEIYNELGGDLDEPVLGVIISSQNQEAVISLIRYLFTNLKN